MIAKDLISNEISGLITSDTGEEALTMMSIFHVRHMPIVNNEQLLGVISEEDIYDNNTEEPIGSYPLSMRRPYVRVSDHLFEVMAKMAEERLTVIPVVDEKENYLGVVTQDDLIQYFASSFSFSEQGSIIVVETTKPNYSLSELARIVEGEGTAVLTTFITNVPDSNTVYVTMKVNRPDVQNIIASLNRFEYTVAASFAEDELGDPLKERYDSLMAYLNV